MDIRIFDVEHGARALVQAPHAGRIALIDCGVNTTTGWMPTDYIRDQLGRNFVDYLIISNADQDHYANLASLRDEISIGTFYKNPSVGPSQFEFIKSKSGRLSQ